MIPGILFSLSRSLSRSHACSLSDVCSGQYTPIWGCCRARRGRDSFKGRRKTPSSSHGTADRSELVQQCGESIRSGTAEPLAREPRPSTLPEDRPVGRQRELCGRMSCTIAVMPQRRTSSFLCRLAVGYRPVPRVPRSAKAKHISLATREVACSDSHIVVTPHLGRGDTDGEVVGTL